jgi:hypothetical protein
MHFIGTAHEHRTVSSRSPTGDLANAGSEGGGQHNRAKNKNDTVILPGTRPVHLLAYMAPGLMVAIDQHRTASGQCQGMPSAPGTHVQRR